MRAFCLICLLFMGCQLGTPIPATPTPAQPPTATPDPNWEQVTTGLEQRFYRAEGGALFQTVRIDPTLYSFRAHYRPRDPLTLQQWRDALPTAIAIINANFYTPQHEILGILISDSQVYGRTYQRGGTFIVQDGVPTIRPNPINPYPANPIEQAVQAFPLLVQGGQAAYANASDNRVARRTIIAQDARGRVLLLVTPGFGWGLYDTSQYLATTDMNVVDAVNMDGGGSTMLYVAASETLISSFDPVPAVLAVYPR